MGRPKKDEIDKKKNENEGYWFGGTLLEIDIYYDHNIDKIYCSESINEVHKYLKREERRKKLNTINNVN